MIYSLSNTSNLSALVETLGISFKYPILYKPRLKIEGYKEQSLSIITVEEPDLITQGIWGILPHNYEGSWKKFQRLKNTLHVHKNELRNNNLYNEALQKRRCLIIVTGFYAYYLNNNSVTNFLIEKDMQKPFYLAGVYNVLEDGFVTCSVINTDADESLDSINNLHKVMPLQIPEIFKAVWLHKKSTIEEIDYILSKPYVTKFKVQEIVSYS